MVFSFGQTISKKRGREDEEEVHQWWMGSTSTSSATAKRLRSSVDGLTINVNNNALQRPSLPHISNSFSLRPQIDSPQMLDSPDAATPTAPEFSATSSPAHSPQHNTEPTDMDMQDDGAVVRIVQSSPPSPWNVPVIGRPPKRSPPPLKSDYGDRFSSSRVPTPIYSSFPPNAQHPPRTSVGGFPMSSQPPRLPSLNTAIQSLQRRDHIMPSPVREADDEMEAEYAFAGSQLSRLSFSSGTGPASFYEDNSNEYDSGRLHSHAGMDIDDHTISPLTRSPALGAVRSRKEQLQQLPPMMLDDNMQQPLMSPPLLSPRTGRARSGAMSSLVSPTLMSSDQQGFYQREQNNRPKKFSFGYRDECDKCRARVAGHFAHFV